MIAFTFDASFQRSILRLMMIDEGFALKVVQWVEAGHFTKESLGWIFQVLSQHWTLYQSRPTDTVLREAVRRLPQAKALRYASEAEQVIALGTVPDAQWVKDQLAEFVKQAIFAVAHQASARPFNAGKPVEAYDMMMKAMERIQDVDFNEVDRIWLFDELPDRQRARIRAAMDPISGRFTTGVPDLDALTDGGVHAGELWVVFAYAKRCKTTWLINQGFHATRVHRKPTVHFVLEGRGEQVAARYDACFSQELYTNVKQGRIDPQLFAQLQHEYLSLRRLMVIRTLNDWDVTILDIQRELHTLRALGFVPEMMITDYMDLGRARDRCDSETQHQVSFARDLKRLHNNTGMAGWSAWQAQRPKPGAHTKKHVLSSANVADAYAKVRIVDGWGSLNATDEEMERGEMRLFWEGHRDAPVNQIWTITNDLARMRMLKSAERYDPEADAA